MHIIEGKCIVRNFPQQPKPFHINRCLPCLGFYTYRILPFASGTSEFQALLTSFSKLRLSSTGTSSGFLLGCFLSCLFCVATDLRSPPTPHAKIDFFERRSQSRTSFVVRDKIRLWTSVRSGLISTYHVAKNRPTKRT